MGGGEVNAAAVSSSGGRCPAPSYNVTSAWAKPDQPPPPVTGATITVKPARTLVLLNMLNPEDLEDDEEYDDLERVCKRHPT